MGYSKIVQHVILKMTHLGYNFLEAIQRRTLYLEKIIWCFACSIWLCLPWCRLKLKECSLHWFINLQNGCHVPTSIAIIWSTEDSNHILILTGKTKQVPWEFDIKLSASHLWDLSTNKLLSCSITQHTN